MGLSVRFINLPIWGRCVSIAAMLLLASCSYGVGKREFRADNVAITARLNKVVVPTDHFKLTTYGKILDQSMPLHVYIEGDGFAWVNKRQISNNPTPTDPLALRLAAQDGAPNILYIARPCQFTPLSEDKQCAQRYWSTDRFAVEVINAVNQAINHYSESLTHSKIEITGYSGGGAVAALVAAQRKDVTFLRTVAGNLDHVALNHYHHVSPMVGSLNAIDVAPKLSHIPQVHFVGGKDKIVPGFIAETFTQKLGELHCSAIVKEEKFTHHEGWVEAWRSLLLIKPEC